MHDLGANAARIRALFEEITTTLEKGEKTVLEQAKPKEEAAPAKKDATQKRVKKRVKKRRLVTRQVRRPPRDRGRRDAPDGEHRERGRSLRPASSVS